MFGSYVAIGDSFTEGLGDWYPDGTPRGWADRLAEALSLRFREDAEKPSEDTFEYANLAIRGRKLRPIIDEQLMPAIAASPDLISFAAGGNDMLRPKFNPEQAVEAAVGVVQKIRDAGIHALVLSGPDPVNNLPMGATFSARGAEYSQIAAERLGPMEGVTFVDNFHDRAFEDSTYWSEDGLHLDSAGHLRITANVLGVLGVDYPEGWEDPRSPAPDPKNYRTPEYFAKYIAPWVGRRLTGRSSGDGRTAKRPELSAFPEAPNA